MGTNETTDGRAFVVSVLRRHDLPTDGLRCVSTAGNTVWMTPVHVVRVSSGRFPGAFAHEARVATLVGDAVPVAAVLAHGTTEYREWILSERSQGCSLAQMWPELGPGERRAAGRRVGSVLAALHAVPLPAGFENPWLATAFRDRGRLADAYHPPPRLAGELLAAAERLDRVDPEVGLQVP